MTHELDSGPTFDAIVAACRVTDEASDTVKRYVEAAMRGYPMTWAYVHSTIVRLEGFGKVWKDGRGFRVFKRISCQYGEWQKLDELLAEAKAHYDQMRAKK